MWQHGWNIIQSELSQTEKDKSCMVSLTSGILKKKKVKLIKMSCQGLGIQEKQRLVKEYKFLAIRRLTYEDLMYKTVSRVENNCIICWESWTCVLTQKNFLKVDEILEKISYICLYTRYWYNGNYRNIVTFSLGFWM